MGQVYLNGKKVSVQFIEFLRRGMKACGFRPAARAFYAQLVSTAWG